MPPELVEEFKKLTGDISGGWEKVKSLPDAFKAFGDEMTKLRSDLDALRRTNLTMQRRLTRPGEVSEECARFLGAQFALRSVGLGRVTEATQVDAIKAIGKEVFGDDARVKTALSTSDIPLPTQFSGDIVELVLQYGQARKYATILPLGSNTVKLPKLGTDPTFGLIAMSATVTEKSPTISFVTFTPSKWGGLVRVPSEIDADSIVAMGQFLARYGARNLARLEDTVYFVADGTATYDSLSGVAKVLDAADTRVTLAGGKTANGDLTMGKMREMRSKVSSAVLGRSAYYFHPTFEQLFSSFNTAGDKPYLANGLNGASLDGFPIRFIDVLPAYSQDAAVSTVFGLFGELSYSYLGVRGGIGAQVSDQAAFTTDELLYRFLERFTIGHMASNHASVVKTAAA